MTLFCEMSDLKGVVDWGKTASDNTNRPLRGLGSGEEAKSSSHPEGLLSSSAGAFAVVWRLLLE